MKLINRVAMSVICYIVTMSLAVLIGAFVHADFRVLEWDIITRVDIVIWGSFASIVLIVIMNGAVGDEDKSTP